MIQFVKGDIFQSDCEAFVNPVNCVGTMGKGLALAFREKFPASMFADYQEACKRGTLQVGKVHVWLNNNGPHIINFPTKKHWRDNSRLEWITAGLADLARIIHENHLPSVAIPGIGCGLGGLAWDDVKAELVKFADLVPNTRVVVYEP